MKRVIRFSLPALAAVAISSAAGAEVRCSEHPLITRAIAAAGSPMRLRLVYAGYSVVPDQSVRPSAPFPRRPWGIDLAVDEPAGAVRYDFHQAIAGDFMFHDSGGFAGGRGFVLDYYGRHEPVTAMPQGHVGFVPQLMLRAIAATPASCSEIAGTAGVHVANFGGSSRDLVFDAVGRLAEVRRAPQPTAAGPLRRDTVFGAYRLVGGSWVPGRITIRASDPVNGSVESVLRLTSASPTRLGTSAADSPAGSRAAPARDTNFSVIPKGGGAYLLRNVAVAGRFSYNVLLVGQADRVLVFDAALDDATSRRVAEEAGRIFPGKPLTLILSHAHGDHIGGLRHYLATSAPIVAPSGMAPLIDRIRAAAGPDLPPAAIREVKGQLTLTDRANPVQLFDFPSAHSDHMIVAYLPKQRLVMQADLINDGDYPANAHSRALLRWIKAQRLVVDEIAGVHGAPVAHDAFTAI